MAVLLCAVCGGPLAATSNAQSTPGVKTDRAVYPEPPLPPLPSAGGKFTDPVFGTQIMRATDATDYPAPGCGTWYSHWPTFNADNTLLLIRCGVDGDAIIKRFDPTRFELAGTLRARVPMLPGGVTLEWQGATWSATDPDLIYVHVNNYNPDYPDTGLKLYTYRPSTNAITPLKDFSSLAPGQPDYLFELHMDARDDVFTFMHKRVGSGSAPIAFIAWRRSDDRVLAHVPNNFNGNACYPDKSGRYVVFTLNEVTVGQPRVRILDLTTNLWETLLWAESDNPPLHGDVGTGVMVGRSPWSGGVTFRRLDRPHSPAFVFDMKDANGVQDWSNDQHMTLYADDEGWVLLGTVDDPAEVNGETGAYEDELMQVATDGSGRIRRLAHTRTKYDKLTVTSHYWGTPKPTISRDSRYIAYTSNWENTNGRYDLFIMKNPLADALSVWFDDALPAGASGFGNNESWSWVGSNPSPFSGASAHQSNLVAGFHNHYFTSATQTLSINTGETLFAYAYIDPGNVPTALMLQWYDGTSWKNAYWGADQITWVGTRHHVGPVPAAGGWVRLEVPAGVVGLAGQTLTGMAFNAYGGRVTWDQAGKLTPPPNDTVWFDDALPAGASGFGNNESWSWVSSTPAPFSGASAHQSALAAGFHNHYFVSATQTLAVSTGNKLFAYAYIDPGNVPTELMLQWYDGTQWRNVYWGADQITWVGTRHHVGPVPAAGGWVRLEVPASLLGLEGKTLTGMAFNAYGGRVTWDRAGKSF